MKYKMIFLIYAAVLVLAAVSVNSNVRCQNYYIVKTGKLDAFDKAEGGGFTVWIDGRASGIKNWVYSNVMNEKPRLNDVVSLGIVDNVQNLYKGELDDAQLRKVIFCDSFFKFFIGWSFILLMILGIKKRADYSKK